MDNLRSVLEFDALRAMRLMNCYAEEGQKDRDRNHVNYGVLIQTLKVLEHLGFSTICLVYKNDDCLICEKLIINGVVLYAESTQPED